MNNILTEFARKELKQGLEKCSEDQILIFKRMYSHDRLELTINDVVDNMPDDKLDWAMTQVDKTLAKTP